MLSIMFVPVILIFHLVRPQFEPLAFSFNVSSFWLPQDTTFMFVIGGLIIAKIIQYRHPYFNANSFLAFWSFSVVTLVTIVGLVST